MIKFLLVKNIPLMESNDVYNTGMIQT